MARSRKHNDNLQRIQDVLDDKHQGKIVVGQYSVGNSETRKVGDKWTDSDGQEWEQKEGYRMKLSNTPAVGLGDNCSDCDNLILQKWDKHMYTLHKRCYHCQIDFEAKLKTIPIRYWAWRRLQEIASAESIMKDMDQWIDEMDTMKKQNVFDKSVANALANGEVDTSLKINKRLV
jgi:hypothetical protein